MYIRIETEQDNQHAALNWIIPRGDADRAQRIASAIYRYWITEGYFTEGRDWLEQSLTIGSGASTAVRGWTLVGAGVAAYFTGDYARATACNEEARVIFSDVGDSRGVASSYGNLGLIADAGMDYDRAVELYEEALGRFRQLDDQTHVRYMVGNLGLIAYFQERYGDANTLMEESLALAREAGDRHSVAISLGNLGMVALEQGDYARAMALQREVLLMRRDLMNQPHLARTLENVAMIAAMTDQPIHAARLFGAADALRDEVGGTLQSNDRAIRDRYITRARTQAGDHAFTAAWAGGATLSPDAALTYAFDDAWDTFPTGYQRQDPTAE
jgi:non-specific serine/threonine protein kinase